MRFSEKNEEWVDVPEWARFLLDFGYYKTPDRIAPRSMTIISMPCDSAAAGLVALGAIRKSLENPLSNDICAHWGRIRNSWGKTLKRRPLTPNGNSRSYTIVRIDGDNVVLKRTGEFRTISAHEASKYCFSGEPYVEVVEGDGLNNSQIYGDLFPAAIPILKANLELTYSGICLAGRKAGAKKTRNVLQDIRFCRDDLESQSATLDQLLAVHDWSPKKISRLSFFNPITKALDRGSEAPNLVVADGDGSFLTVIDDETFSKSHIISIIDRSVDRERLDSLAHRLASLSQWYDREPIPASPRGVVISIWKKR